ncbi:MAG: glutamate--tRNA ligase [Dehalococcoidia bacterium]|nr:glutamate--tRNA ligase [Dehalococcoidia bacterium]
MPGPARVRYAPSPTGEPHVGNIRTALFNWLYARHTGGQFILRIEDTDQNRIVPGALDSILESLRWLGLDWDEGPEVGGPYGPYFQSQRLHIYREIADRLLSQDSVYSCYCSPERLDEMRKEQQRRKEPPKYDGQCRYLSEAEKKRGVGDGVNPVVRFKTPLEGHTSFYDLIRGEITVANSTLDDFVLLKSDGFPTYHLANVIDDHLMEITHIMRADEWLASTPRHMLLYRALGFEPPVMVHLPLILGPDRAKLSKRHGATSLVEYKENGFLPEVMINFLALLGWSFDEKTEIFSVDELIEHFALERIGKTGAIFNHEKLLWMNGLYMRERLTVHDLMGRVLPFLEQGLPPEVPRPFDGAYVEDIMALLQDRIKLLSEGPELTEFFFMDDLEYETPTLLGKDFDRERAEGILSLVQARLSDIEDFSTEALEGMTRRMAEELGLKTGSFFGLLRVAFTGRTAAPPLFETMEALGKERCLYRIERSIRKLHDG